MESDPSGGTKNAFLMKSDPSGGTKNAFLMLSDNYSKNNLVYAAFEALSFGRISDGLYNRVNSLYLGALVTVHRTPFIKYQLDS